MLKKLLILFFVFVLLTAMGVYLLTSPWFVTSVAKNVVNSRSKDWTLKEFTIGKIQVNPRPTLNLSDIEFVAEYVDPFNAQKKEWHGRIPALSLSALTPAFAAEQKILFIISEISLQSEDLQLRGVSFEGLATLSNKQWNLVSGNLKVGSLETKDILLKDIQAVISGNANKLTVDPWQAQGMGGTLKGQLTASDHDYTMKANIFGAQLNEIPGVDGLGEVRGQIDGSFAMSGTFEDMQTIEGDFNALKGAEIPAAFLEMVLPYIPRSAQRKILEDLIANKDNIFFDYATIQLKTLQAESLTSVIKLSSQKLNLNMEITIDLNVEGGLSTLWSYLP